MSYHLRIDDSQTFYSIERWGANGSGIHHYWMGVADRFISEIPQHLRWSKADNRHKYPFDEFSASGAVWQKTQNHGTYDKKAAMVMLHMLSEHNPGERFRIVLVTVSLARTVIAESMWVCNRQGRPIDADGG